MAGTNTKLPALPGLAAAFEDEPNEVLPASPRAPTREQRMALEEVSAQAGFTQRGPGKPKPVVKTSVRGRAGQEEADATFDDRINVRVTAHDRQRFDDFAWRNRLSKGAAMGALLDLVDKAEPEKGRGE